MVTAHYYRVVFMRWLDLFWGYPLYGENDEGLIYNLVDYESNFKRNGLKITILHIITALHR